VDDFFDPHLESTEAMCAGKPGAYLAILDGPLNAHVQAISFQLRHFLSLKLESGDRVVSRMRYEIFNLPKWSIVNICWNPGITVSSHTSCGPRHTRPPYCLTVECVE
jgi:hypothetical protein